MLAVGILSVVIVMIVLASNRFADPSEKIEGSMWWFVLGCESLALYVAVSLSTLRAEVHTNYFVISYGPWGWPRQRINWKNVASVRVIDVRPTEWGGWGYRWVPWKRATAAVMRAGEGLRFDFANNKVFVVTIDDADNALAAIRRALDELPPA